MNRKSILKTLGCKIQQVRESKGLSQQELAYACNFEKSNMSRLEAGNTNPTFITLCKIAISLEIEVWELVDIELNEID